MNGDEREPLEIVTTVLPTFVIGQRYRFQLEAVGGRPPYRWDIVRGSLPPGLDLDEDGLITGIPEERDDR